MTWTSHLTSQNLSLFTCQVGIMTLSLSWGCCEDERRAVKHPELRMAQSASKGHGRSLHIFLFLFYFQSWVLGNSYSTISDCYQHPLIGTDDCGYTEIPHRKLCGHTVFRTSWGWGEGASSSDQKMPQGPEPVLANNLQSAPEAWHRTTEGRWNIPKGQVQLQKLCFTPPKVEICTAPRNTPCPIPLPPELPGES